MMLSLNFNKFLEELSPVEFVDGIYLKRNDKLSIYNVNGGKSQGAYYLVADARSKGFNSVTTVGSRFSPQCNIVSDICENEGITCHLFMPKAKEVGKVIEAIQKRSRSVLHLIPYGYTSNLIYNAKKFCQQNDSYFIPFGMKCAENINVIARQCRNIPKNIKRIVVPIGSGVTFCGVLKGLMDLGRCDIKVVGIYTGADSSRIFILNNLPFMNEIKYELRFYKPQLTPSKRYEEQLDIKIGDVSLNERYEAKCFQFLEKDDLFWIVGR